jgi:hypothetical protein
MFRAFALLFTPLDGWTRLGTLQPGVALVLFLNTLPLLALGLGGEYYGITHWGLTKQSLAGAQSAGGDPQLALRYLEFQAVGLITATFLAALMLHWISASFNLRTTFKASFAAVAFSLGPYFLCRALDGLPSMNTWACYGVGILLAVNLLYHGIGCMLQPEATKGFGLLICGTMTVSVLTAVVHLLAQAVLEGKVRLPF